MNAAKELAILIGIISVSGIVHVTAQEGPLTLQYASLVHRKGEKDRIDEVFRHGARSPIDTYPNDPYKEEDWPQGYGQLNWNGARQHYQLGRLIKQRYTVEHQLLSSNYTRDEVYVRSTDFDRTLMSVLSQLSGLFPPEEDRRLNGTIDWQPIPVHTVPQENENLLQPLGTFYFALCPRYRELLLVEDPQTDYFKQVQKEHEQFLSDLEISTGVDNLGITRNFLVISDAVSVELENGRNPGSWVNDSVISTMRNLTSIYSFLWFNGANSLEKQRLTAGNLVGQIIDRMQKKIENEALIRPGSNLVLYSGHDTTVAAFLSALQIYDDNPPPYAATVFVELYSDSNSNHFVRVWYLNEHTVDGFDLSNTSALLIPMTIPNCDQLCPLDKFIELTADVVPSDWEQECQVNRKGCTLTKINGRVKHNQRKKKTTLTFSSDDDLRTTYRCKVDKRDFQQCESPLIWKDMKKGNHTVIVRGLCINNRSSMTRRRKFKFQIR